MDRQTRLEKNRSGFWEIRWTEQDERTGRGRTRSVSTRTEDKQLAEEVRRSFLKQEREQARNAGGVRIGALLDEYRVSAEARSVGRSQLACLKTVRDYFGAMEPQDVTPAEVLAYRTARGRTDGTLRRELSTLMAGLRWAVKHGKISAAPIVDMPATGDARAVFLPEDVERELFTVAASSLGRDGRLSQVGRFVCIGLDTGARRGAIEGLTWDRVDLARGTIDFRDPAVKVSKKRRVVTPIPDRLMPVMLRAREERRLGSRYVLDELVSIGKTFRRFMEGAGFEQVTPHVLRHTRITLLLRAGVPVWDVSALVGASADVIHAVYGHHVTDERLRAQANRRVA